MVGDRRPPVVRVCPSGGWQMAVALQYSRPAPIRQAYIKIISKSAENFVKHL